MAVAAAVHRVQQALIDSAAVPERQLLVAAPLLSRPDFDDVVAERNIAGLCGDPRCPERLPASRPHRGRYRISLREHRVYDLEEAAKCCSEVCLVSSRAFAASLEDDRVLGMSQAQIERILKLFEGGGKDFREDLEEDGEFGFSKLSIKEKEDAGGVKVSLDEWMGPADAIEGYVPQHDWNRGSKFSTMAKPTKGKEDTGISDMDFMSTLFVGDGHHEVPSKMNMDPLQDVSEKITKQLEKVALEEKKVASKKMLSKPSKAKPMKRVENNKNEDLDFKGALIIGDQSNAVQPTKISAVSRDPMKCFAKGVEDGLYLERKKEPNQTALKSSLKTSGSRSASRTVTWADGRKDEAAGGQHRVLNTSRCSNIVHEEEIDSSLRLASAEACAAALRQAAEAVASGESEAVDAVCEAGLVIVPPPQYEKEEGQSEADEDMFEFDKGIVKWPKKTVLLETDMFDVEDSWHDTPPEGLSLTLSSFATMWMALFEWITCFSLAYIYGHDDSSQDDFLVVNGREYLRKIVLRDGKSSEIRQTIDLCIGLAIPGIVLDLKLPTPVSTLEKAVGCLLDTMSFVEALPPFRSKQWHVIILLFIDALSVHRLPSLTSYMTGRSTVLHKVLNAAQISGEEYESMRDLILPLGRVPQFSMQSGG